MIEKNKEFSFANLGISPSILKQIQKLGFNKPTPIQAQAIPIAILGNDLMGIAQTGTGKTIAFGIPLIHSLSQKKGTGLILLPTRELAIQVEQSLQAIGREFGLKTVVLIGGTPIGPQIRALAHKPQIIIATPGRLIDHINQKKVMLNDNRILILDEADLMLDMGFGPDINKIISTLPKKDRQTMLFSATMPTKIINLAKNYMRSPLCVEVAPAGTVAENIQQEVFIVPKIKKLALLEELLKQYQNKVLVFSRTKHGAKKITRALNDFGYRAAEIHSNRSLAQRSKALKDFKSNFRNILVATDIAARGIDVKDIELVINYDLPDDISDYIHRIGRTGRAGKNGKAISFAVPEQKRDLFAIEKLINFKLPIKPLPNLPNKSEKLEKRENHWKTKSPHRKNNKFSNHKKRAKKPKNTFKRFN